MKVTGINGSNNFHHDTHESAEGADKVEPALGYENLHDRSTAQPGKEIVTVSTHTRHFGIGGYREETLAP